MSFCVKNKKNITGRYIAYITYILCFFFLCLGSTMDAKFHLCLLLILLGAITVLGAHPGDLQKDAQMGGGE